MVYLDNAASTAPAPEALAALTRTAGELYANPSSAHAPGAAAARALEQARGAVAALIGAQPAEIVFTSGGTEADALAVTGAALCGRGRHLVASAIEHPAVLRTLEGLVELLGIAEQHQAPKSCMPTQPGKGARRQIGRAHV